MKRLLLDTHIFLWMLAAPERLAPHVLAAMRDPSNEVIFSAVVAWEIAVKRAKGKLNFVRSPQAAAKSQNLPELAISAIHCEIAAALENHHRDPFDRLLLAQAETEGLVLVTHDAMLARYGVPILRNSGSLPGLV